MIARFKAKLRAWLVDLVREAIRAELAGFSMVMPSDFAAAVIRKAKPEPITRIRAGADIPASIEPSFEDMQSASIAAQKEHYEPRKA